MILEFDIMKGNWYKTIILFFSLFIAYWLFKGENKQVYITKTGFTQGTTYKITYKAKDSIDYQPDFERLLQEIDNSLSIYNPHSVISRINENDPAIVPDEHFIKVFKMARKVYEKSGGLFDITVAPLVNAWGFGITGQEDVDSVKIKELLQYVGMDKVKLENGKIRKSNPGIMFDVNAIAQGYTVDVIEEFLNKEQVRNYMVEVGGEVRVRGKNSKNKMWRIGIDKPVDNNLIPGADLQAIIEIKDKSLATSGNYRKFYIKDGVKYSHTINPKTGYPALSRLLSSTVIADDCITADAYATAFMVMGIEKSIEFLRQNPFLEAYLVYGGEDGELKEYMTESIKDMIKHP